ncbi:thioredoxin [Acinetobacter guillouiae]|uniref:Thioredoxin n=1 Tax=Acinetobacter guillouiae TaxID=106649 RepID=A0A8X8GCT4_ACIGI|nr:thioredoxin [Acinetobacter guillouiae]
MTLFLIWHLKYMKKNILIALLFLFTSQAYANVSDSFNRMYNLQLASLDNVDQNQFKKQLQMIYQQELADIIANKKFKNLSDIQLRELLRATGIVNFHLSDEQYIVAMKMVFDELVQRNSTKPMDYRLYYTALVAARQFDQARQFAQNHPNISLQSLPRIKFDTDLKLDQPAILKLNPDMTMSVQNFNLDLSEQVIIVASTGCGVSLRARDAIFKNKQIKGLLKPYTTWLEPQTGFLSAESIQEWSKDIDHQAELVVVYDQSKFPQLGDWTMPTFYFLKNGKVVYQFSGWSEQGKWQELQQGLEKINLSSE